METKKRKFDKGKWTFIAILLLLGSSIGNVLAVLVPVIDDTQAQFTTITGESIYMSGATPGQIPIIGLGGLLTGDADLTFVGGNTLETVNISASGVSATSFYGTGLTTGRIPVIGAGGLIGDDADLTFVGGDTLTTANISTSSLYVNVDGSVQNYTAWVEAEILAGGGATLDLDPSPDSDHSGGGLYASMTVGENVVIGEVLYMKNDGKLWKADANSTSTMPIVAIALGSITADTAGNVLKMGFIRDDSWGWTTGYLLFASGNAGEMTETAPNTSGDQVQVLGYAVSAHVVYFNPSYVLVEVV